MRFSTIHAMDYRNLQQNEIGQPNWLPYFFLRYSSFETLSSDLLLGVYFHRREPAEAVRMKAVRDCEKLIV